MVEQVFEGRQVMRAVRRVNGGGGGGGGGHVGDLLFIGGLNVARRRRRRRRHVYGHPISLFRLGGNSSLHPRT